ncbi:glycosyltransferase [bacterium]|nr:glycosyltransferase [bacterium]
MKRVLMVALDFPPCKSAGVQRTLKFAEYLKDFGWEPIILTVNKEAFENLDSSQEIPTSIEHIYRSFAFNASRDFAIKGKYLSIMKEPDRWWTWKYTAIPQGKKIIESLKPDVIWSTYPVPTAHIIAKKLAKWSGLPWIADYRDPVQSRYDSSVKSFFNLDLKIEKSVLNTADKVVFTTKQAQALYQSLYQDLPANKFHTIENGYDENNFHQVGSMVKQTATLSESQPFTLLHSGAVYKNGRDPQLIFLALAALKQRGVICADTFQLVFRALNGLGYQSVIQELDIVDLIQFKPSVSYLESLKEMVSADALLLIQGPLFNNQIPSKVFEYIRSNRAILAFTSKAGATAQILEGVERSYSAGNQYEIEECIVQILSVKNKSRENVSRFSRYERTEELAKLLDCVDAL